MSTGSETEVSALLAELDAGGTLTGEALGSVFDRDHDWFASHTVGIVYDTLARDRVTAHVEVGRDHQQPWGIVNGGVWCAVVESVGSVAAGMRVASAGKLVVGVHNATDFLRPVRTGRIDAVATPIHVGRTQQLWQVELTRAEDGKAVARGQLRLQVIDAAQLGAGG